MANWKQLDFNWNYVQLCSHLKIFCIFFTMMGLPIQENCIFPFIWVFFFFNSSAVFNFVHMWQTEAWSAISILFNRGAWFWFPRLTFLCQVSEERDSLVALLVKNLPAPQETQVQFLGREDPLEQEMPIHSSILVWRISWTEEPGGPQSMGSHRVSRT